MEHGIIRVAADGSAGSRRAFAWALEEAALRRCAVELITVYRYDEGESRDAARESAERALHATMDDLVAGRADLPRVSWHVVEGEAADVLVRESAQSLLLVMGSHGVEGMIHSALGSVADTCAKMADCPVVIIPPPRREETTHSGLTSPAGG
jgi:nucleotide-binding universal stress UspA family protein